MGVSKGYIRVVCKNGHWVLRANSTPADPLNFHVDHVTPLAHGGEHSYANVQVAHPTCNAQKGARVPSH